jgi:protocatechuate 3,4-dioxygenase beta subunit/5-hydroxyisourate hydrolase-like protein (transthyretin family)
MRAVLVLVSLALLVAGVVLFLLGGDADPLGLTPTDHAPATGDVTGGRALNASVETPPAAIPAMPFDGAEDKADAQAAPVAGGANVIGRLLTEDGEPIREAALSLEIKRVEFGQLKDERRSSKSGPDGRFKFAGIATGSTLVLRATPLTTLELKTPPAKLSESGHDFGTLVPERGALIRGVITTARGAPAAGVRVVAERARREEAFAFLGNTMEPTNSSQRAAMSDAEGRFCIQGLPQGAMRVSAREDGSALGTECFSAAGSTDVRLALPEADERSGMVTDEAGAPLANAHVRINEGAPKTDVAEFDPASKTRMRTQRLTTDAAGRFVLKNVPADMLLKADVSRDGFLPTQMAVERGENICKLKRCGVIWGVVKSAADVALASFHATVQRAVEYGFDLGSASGRIAPKVLTGAEAAQLAHVPLQDGLYAVANVPETPLTLSFVADGHARVRHENVTTPSGTTLRWDVRLEQHCEIAGVVLDPSGKPTAGARVSFSPANATPQFTNQTLSEESGLAVAALVTEAAMPMGRGPEGLAQSTLSDATGHFRIAGLAAGSGSLIAEHGLFADSERMPLKLPLDTQEELRLALRPGGSIEGQALDEEGKGFPHATVLAHYAREKSDRRSVPDAVQAIADAQGKYRLDGLLPGTWDLKLEVGSRGGERRVFFFEMGIEAPTRTGWTRCEVSSGSVTRVDLALPPVGQITGVVLSAGRPVADVNVDIAPKQPRDASSPNAMSMGAQFLSSTHLPVTTSADGRFRFEGQKPGEFTLTARPRGSDSRSSVDVNVVAKSTQHVEIILPGGTIEGRLLDDKSGQPLAHVSVEATKRKRPDENGDILSSTSFVVASSGTDEDEVMSLSFGAPDPVVTDAEGRFAVRHLEEGTWDLSFRGGGIVPLEHKGIELARDALHSGLICRASLGCTLILQFSANSDRDVEDAIVLIQCGEQTEHAWMRRGHRALRRGLAAGPCTITVTHHGSERRVERSITLHSDGENKVEIEF